MNKNTNDSTYSRGSADGETNSKYLTVNKPINN